MKNIAKITWVMSIIIVSLSMIWFLIGSTACFQRNIDIVSMVVFLIVWYPAFVFVILSVWSLKKDWFPNNILGKVSLIIAVISLSLFFTVTLVRNTSLYGWAKESVKKDYIQTTIDEKYEYRLELINVFQRNSYARIYIKNVVNGEEMNISLDIPTKEKTVIFGGEGSLTSAPDKCEVWSVLTPSNKEDVYILTTTELFDRENTYCFQIDMKTKTAVPRSFGD